MSNSFPALDAFKVEVTPDVRERHLAAVSEALTARTRRRSNRKLLAVAIATVVLLPVVAFAAERAGPGDLLYPLKRALVEPVVSLFDSDVAAVHRVEEVEDLFAHEAELDVIKEHIVTAREAADQAPDLIERIDRIEQAVQDRAEPDFVRPTDQTGTGDTAIVDAPVDSSTPVTETTQPSDPPPRDGRGGGGDAP